MKLIYSLELLAVTNLDARLILPAAAAAVGECEVKNLRIKVRDIT